jgi:hypothetical protein
MADTFRLDLTEDPKVISGSRVFDAPRSLVFEAWTSILPTGGDRTASR